MKKEGILVEQLIPNLFEDKNFQSTNLKKKRHNALSRLKLFLNNLGTISDKHSERFHKLLKWRSGVVENGLQSC